MYIAPNTIARVLKNVRLDNSYSDTIYFASKEAQTSYFTSKTKYTFTNMTYQRKERRLVVKQVADNMFDCNYLMFQNSSYGNKWFYAFITNVEWLNNETAAIYFEIDDIQTWFFDFYLDSSFVEREHSATDAVGDNLIPDNLETGEYVSEDFVDSGIIKGYSYVVAATFNEKYESVSGGLYSGIYGGLYFNVFDTPKAVDEFLIGLPGEKTDGIVSIFMMPTAFVDTNASTGAKSYDVNIDKKVSNIWKTFAPHNNKIYTYPYNFLYCTNLAGTGTAFPYEYFSSEKCTFLMAGDMSCNPEILLVPKNYKGVVANYNEKMTLSGFPQCSWSTDSFKAWLAQSAIPTLAGATMSGVINYTGKTDVIQSSLATSATGNWMGRADSMYSAGASLEYGMYGTVAGLVAQGYQKWILPPQAHGNSGNSAAVAMRIKNFAFMHMHIREEFARIIDSFWDKFGYPVRRVKIPSTHNRPHWNYVKTVGCDAHGSIPSSAMSNIKSIHDKGITYWMNGDEIGNYLLDNRLKGSS